MSDVSTERPTPPHTGGPFDDHLDTATRIANREVLTIIGRSLSLLSSVGKLFGAKLALATLALIPALYAPWIPKIVVDQVLLGQPFDDTEVPIPPHLAPFVEIVRDFGPMEIMGAIVVFYLTLLLFLGRGGVQEAKLAQGEDSATQAENAMNKGDSRAGGVVGIVDELVQIRISQRITNRLRTTLFQRMARLPMTTLDDHRIGDAVYRVMYDAPMLPNMCYRVTLEPLFVIGLAGMQLYFLNYTYGTVAPEIVWLALALVPIALLMTLPFSSLTRRVQQDSRAAGAATTNAIEESLSNIAAVQSLGGMAQDKARIDAQSTESFRRYRFIKIVEIIVRFVPYIAFVGMAVYAFWLLSDRVISGTITPGDFTVLFGLAMSLGGSAREIGTRWIELQGNAAAIRRVLVFVDMPSEDTGPNRRPLDELATGVSIEHVDFDYPDGKQALKDINLDLRLGELIAIVGPTGAGKTSLAYLIPGFLRPTRGRVLFDGQNIAEVDVDSLRDQVSYVFQEHLLLSESVRDNLLLANPDASDDDVRGALADAGALPFVDALPEGIDTVLGRSGDTLSVGQKQRLCIARGLVRNTPILILDEPTAALDPQTENELVRTLTRASEGRLVIVIAHRLSTIRQADRIVFLEEGQIRDVGSHEALIADQTSRYRRFVELQGGI